jgi:hypothetical protein
MGLAVCGNPLLNAIDVSSNPLLEQLGVGSTGLTELDLSLNPKLQSLSCFYCSYLTNLAISTDANLMALDLLDCPVALPDMAIMQELVWLKMPSLTMELSIADNPNLNFLGCYGASLSQDDVNNLFLNLDGFGITNGYFSLLQEPSFSDPDLLEAQEHLIEKHWSDGSN